MTLRLLLPVAQFTLVLCVDYGGRWDIASATQKIAAEVQMGRLRPSDITEATVGKFLQTEGLPDPDLCVRTAGEQRISNFLLWQMAYTEFYFANCYWPDFDTAALNVAVDEYYSRQRRFGLRDAVDEEAASQGDESRCLNSVLSRPLPWFWVWLRCCLI